MRLSVARQLAADMKGEAAPIVLVTAGVFAGLAPLVGLSFWVSPAAALIAMLSGARVLLSDIIAPARARTAARAVRPLHTSGEDGAFRRVANILQIGAGVWVAPAYLAQHGTRYRVGLPSDESVVLSLRCCNDSQTIAVFHSSADWPWVAKPQESVPEPGDRARVVGWLVGGAISAMQAAVDCTVQESQAPELITMLGPTPPPGSAGSAVILARTGRVVGILTGVGPLDRQQRIPASGNTGIVLGASLTALPPQCRARD
ncbi:hypothetical protein [Streptomyces sp. NPDC053542]|uniref:hypothetical protein n=1 Tax=Streptomyces sp. NPDC053542 TaxID=3365710 RepID=UPI0037D01B4C